MPLPVARKNVKPEQILTYFGIEIDYNQKVLCPLHEDKAPSMQVNNDYVFCYGCKASLDTAGLAKVLFDKQGQPKTYAEIYEWLAVTEFSETELTYAKSTYKGPINDQLIDYWHKCLFEYNKVTQLKQERLFTDETIKKFKLGYRPDHNAWVIPFLNRGKAEIVQFRTLEKTTFRDKYYGIKGHQRGSIMNIDILTKPLPYVVVLMGAFDGVLAAQDGLYVVSMNGSMPFKATEKERVQTIFSQQDTIFIVPDNQESEYAPANTLADWLGGEVKKFPKNLPEGTDYIDYRKLGYTTQDFKRDVLGLKTVPRQLIDNLVSLYQVRDKFDLAYFHLNWYKEQCSYREIAGALASVLVNEKSRLNKVNNEADLLNIIQNPQEVW